MTPGSRRQPRRNGSAPPLEIGKSRLNSCRHGLSGETQSQVAPVPKPKPHHDHRHQIPRNSSQHVMKRVAHSDAPPQQTLPPQQPVTHILPSGSSLCPGSSNGDVLSQRQQLQGVTFQLDNAATRNQIFPVPRAPNSIPMTHPLTPTFQHPSTATVQHGPTSTPISLTHPSQGGWSVYHQPTANNFHPMGQDKFFHRDTQRFDEVMEAVRPPKFQPSNDKTNDFEDSEDHNKLSADDFERWRPFFDKLISENPLLSKIQGDLDKSERVKSS